MATRYLQFPVRETGVYKNEQIGKLQFYFVRKDTKEKALIGECEMNLPTQVKDEWETQTANSLKALLSAHVVEKVKCNIETSRRTIVVPKAKQIVSK